METRSGGEMVGGIRIPSILKDNWVLMEVEAKLLTRIVRLSLIVQFIEAITV